MAHSSTWAPIKSIRNGGPRDMRSSLVARLAAVAGTRVLTPPSCQIL